MVKGMVRFGLRFQIPSNRNQQPILQIPSATHLAGSSWPLVQGRGSVPPPDQKSSLLNMTLCVGGGGYGLSFLL